VQLTDKLEAKLAMERADWECWKKLKERFKQILGPFLFDCGWRDCHCLAELSVRPSATLNWFFFHKVFAPWKCITAYKKVGTTTQEGVTGACLDNPQLLRSSNNSNDVA